MSTLTIWVVIVRLYIGLYFSYWISKALILIFERQLKSNYKLMNIKRLLFGLVILTIAIVSCNGNMQKQKQELKSPDGKISIAINLESGQPTYQVDFNGNSVIDPSTLGFDFTNMPAIKSGWEIVSAKQTSSNSKWEMP
ncbi:MAG: hypothetical protein ACI93S_000161, partial [Ancylomarina sp.]